MWAEVDLFMMGWPCQDLSRANIYGKGLLGPRSSLFFHGARLWGKVRAANPDAVLLGECVARWNKRGHYRFASDTVLKVQPVVVCSGGHSYCRRERAYWLSWRVGTLTKCRADAADILDEGRHPVDKHGSRVTKLATLMVHRSSWSTKNPVWDATLGKYDDLRIHEAERAMEMPEGHTAMGVGVMVIPPEERFKASDNCKGPDEPQGGRNANNHDGLREGVRAAAAEEDRWGLHEHSEGSEQEGGGRGSSKRAAAQGERLSGVGFHKE